MKKYFYVSVLVAFLFATAESFALTPTPAPTEATASPSGDISRIEKIKEMVAQKVASLRLVEKRGLLGTVKEVSTTQITIENKEKDERIIDIDELTKFQDPGSKSFGVSDIEKDNTLSIVGHYNKDTKRLLARFITRVNSFPIFMDGVVSDKDRDNFTITVIDKNGKSKIVNVETTTKTQEYQKGDGMKKSGYSRITIGERLLVYGFPDTKNKDEIIASRVMRLVDIPASPGAKKFVNQTAPVNTTPSVSQ